MQAHVSIYLYMYIDLFEYILKLTTLPIGDVKDVRCCVYLSTYIYIDIVHLPRRRGEENHDAGGNGSSYTRGNVYVYRCICVYA